MADWREQLKIDAGRVRESGGRFFNADATARGNNVVVQMAGAVAAATVARVTQRLSQEASAAKNTVWQVLDLRLRSGESFLSQPQQAQRFELTQEQDQTNGRGRSR